MDLRKNIKSLFSLALNPSSNSGGNAGGNDDTTIKSNNYMTNKGNSSGSKFVKQIKKLVIQKNAGFY